MARSNDALFWADRSWSHGIETRSMKPVEDAFQALVERIILLRKTVFDDREVAIISNFYSLWQARAERRHLPMQSLMPKGTLGVSRHASIDDLERLEKNGIIATRPDGSFAMRDLMGPAIMLASDRINDALAASSWGLVEPISGEFCIPDVPQHGVVPLTPRLALVPNSPTGRITERNLAELNRRAFDHAEEYVFARDLKQCPGLAV